MKILDHNAETQETIKREATIEEVKQFEADAIFIDKIKTEAAKAKAEAEAKLAALGLQPADLRALGL